MASILGVSISSYQKYETGERKIPKSLVQKICDTLQIDSEVIDDENDLDVNQAFELSNKIQSLTKEQQNVIMQMISLLEDQNAKRKKEPS